MPPVRSDDQNRAGTGHLNPAIAKIKFRPPGVDGHDVVARLGTRRKRVARHHALEGDPQQRDIDHGLAPGAFAESIAQRSRGQQRRAAQRGRVLLGWLGKVVDVQLVIGRDLGGRV